MCLFIKQWFLFQRNELRINVEINGRYGSTVPFFQKLHNTQKKKGKRSAAVIQCAVHRLFLFLDSKGVSNCLEESYCHKEQMLLQTWIQENIQYCTKWSIMSVSRKQFCARSKYIGIVFHKGTKSRIQEWKYQWILNTLKNTTQFLWGHCSVFPISTSLHLDLIQMLGQKVVIQYPQISCSTKLKWSKTKISGPSYNS